MGKTFKRKHNRYDEDYESNSFDYHTSRRTKKKIKQTEKEKYISIVPDRETPQAEYE